MANGLFYSFRNGVLGAHATEVDMTTSGDDIGIIFIDAGDDIPVLATDDFLSDLASGSRAPALAAAPNLSSKTVGTVAVGVFDAADTTFTALTGDQSEYLVMFKDTGTDTTCNLIASWDTATGLPLTPNGGDVTVAWPAGGIFTF